MVMNMLGYGGPGPKVTVSPAQTMPFIPANSTISAAGSVPTQAPNQYVPPTGLIGSEQAILGGYSGAEAALNNAMTPFGSYSTNGVNANQLQADLSGANGPAAERAAYSRLDNSAGTKWLLGQGQRAIERSAAAKGGLLSGNVLSEINRNALGVVQQGYNDRFDKLGTVAANGMQADTIKAGLNQSLADLRRGTGLELGAGRYQAGRDIATTATNAANSVADLINKQGITLSDGMRSDLSTITNMIYQSGIQDKVDNQQLAAILANITGGQSSQLSSAYTNLGASTAAGKIGQANAIQNGLTQAIQLGLIG